MVLADMPSHPPQEIHYSATYQHKALFEIPKLPKRGAIRLAAVIRPKPKENLTYEQLPCTEEQSTIITTLISWMGEHGWIWLMGHGFEMKRMGAQITQVHPLKFMETIFTNPYLVENCMPVLMDDFLIRGEFMKGLGPSLDAKSATKELDQYIPDFAEKIGVPHEELVPYFAAKNWEALVNFLVDRLSHPVE